MLVLMTIDRTSRDRLRREVGLIKSQLTPDAAPEAAKAFMRERLGDDLIPTFDPAVVLDIAEKFCDRIMVDLDNETLWKLDRDKWLDTSLAVAELSSSSVE
jgi:hypothetical protein